MQIEDVAGVGFTSRRTTKQQGNLTVGPGLLGQIVVNNQAVLTAVTEVFAHRGTGVRCNVLQSCRFRGRSSHDDRVFHGAVLFELADNVGDGGSLLANSDINADQVLALLVDDRIKRNGRLTCLAVTNDQFALAAADRNHRVDGLQTGLNRLAHGLTFDHARSDLFNSVEFLGVDRTLAVDGLAQSVDHSADQSRADRHGKNAAGRLDRIAFRNLFVITENNCADGITFKVQREAVGVIGEFKHFTLHHVVKTVNTANAIGNRNYGSLSTEISGDAKAFNSLLEQFADFTGIELHH